MSIFFISLAALIFWLIGGGILLAVASSWTPQPGKKQFVAYVSLMYLILPIMELIFFVTWMFWQNYYSQSYYGGYGPRYRTGFDFFRFLFYVNVVLFVMALLGSQCLLIIYAIGRRSIPIIHHTTETGMLPASRSCVDGRIWKVSRPASELVAILRRREWAFLIDIAPCVLFFVGYVFVLGVSVRDDVYASYGLLLPTSLLCVEILGIVYLVLKDIFDGQSIGKRISGCRVVDFQTGGPVRTEQAVTRNLVFLIPLFPLVELAAASFRADRRRFGDLIAGTIVVPAQPDVIDGVVQLNQMKLKAENNSLPVKHPLDD